MSVVATKQKKKQNNSNNNNNNKTETNQGRKRSFDDYVTEIRSATTDSCARGGRLFIVFGYMGGWRFLNYNFYTFSFTMKHNVYCFPGNRPIQFTYKMLVFYTLQLMYTFVIHINEYKQ